jgi:hypothetical protein
VVVTGIVARVEHKETIRWMKQDRNNRNNRNMLSSCSFNLDTEKCYEATTIVHEAREIVKRLGHDFRCIF